MLMKESLIAIAMVFIFISCTKENPQTVEHEKTIPITEFEALKQEVAEMKELIANLKPGEAASGVSNADFDSFKESTTNEIDALKKENEDLKSQIGLFTAGFFEVDGLRFDKNGTLISVAKIENVVEEKLGGTLTLTTTRKYDSQGRLIEIYSSYNGGSIVNYGPYEWKKIMYEYNGMTCKITTQTATRNRPVDVPYDEEVKTNVYW